MKRLYSKEIEQNFTDCIYKCVSNEIKEKGALLVLLRYNYKYVFVNDDIKIIP